MKIERERERICLKLLGGKLMGGWNERKETGEERKMATGKRREKAAN